jgi:Phytanoyl-CoA dioxygenase (PhyH)
MGYGQKWIEEYWARGFVILREVFPIAEMLELGRYFDEVLALGVGLDKTTKNGLAEYRVVPINGKPTLKFAKWASSAHEGLTRYRTSTRLLSIVKELLGPDLRQITNQMHWKNPGDGVSFQMHQDCTFRKPDAAYRDLYHSFLQTGIAVDPSTEENGCLQLVPTSHLEPVYHSWFLSKYQFQQSSCLYQWICSRFRLRPWGSDYGRRKGCAASMGARNPLGYG